MSRSAVRTVALVCAGLSAMGVLQADDRQLVEDYLNARGAAGAVLRPITEDYVGRAFPNFTFFGAIYRQFPVAVQCPQAAGLKCANLFFVKDGQVDFVSNTADLEFFFAAELAPAASPEAAVDAAGAWLRFSEELKQDLFYTFSAPQTVYSSRDDAATVRARADVSAGGEGSIDALIVFGGSGTFLRAMEKSALRPGIRPICQATKLLDPDPIVRRMAEQDLLVMGRAAKPYLDDVRRAAPPGLQQAIDRIWQRILERSR